MTSNMVNGASGTPTLGLDLDGCIDEAPDFFMTLSKVWPGRVVIVTYRGDRAKAEADLAKYNIRYTDLVLVNRFHAKAEVIVEMGISIFVDDQPEMIKNIPEVVSVMLFRNAGNFSYEEKLWILSDRTGKLI